MCGRFNIPSLKNCSKFTVTGKIFFSPGVICIGEVEFINNTDKPITLEPNIYKNCKIVFNPCNEI